MAFDTGKGWGQRKPLSPVSKKRAKQSASRRAILHRYPRCQIIDYLRACVPFDQDQARAIDEGIRDCNGRQQGLHELRKRSAGGSLDNPSNLLGACIPCNGWVERWPDLAHRLGLVVRPGDPEWDELDAAPSKVVPFSAPRSIP